VCGAICYVFDSYIYYNKNVTMLLTCDKTQSVMGRVRTMRVVSTVDGNNCFLYTLVCSCVLMVLLIITHFFFYSDFEHLWLLLELQVLFYLCYIIAFLIDCIYCSHTTVIGSG
jgi:hypothetical protein